jgi:biopolymer transport protein ExbB/TolQ
VKVVLPRLISTGLSSMLMTTNLAVSAFALTSVGMYTWCLQRQRKEASGIAQAMHGLKLLNEKKAREKAEEEAAAEVARLKAEEEKKRNQKWYKPW